MKNGDVDKVQEEWFSSEQWRGSLEVAVIIYPDVLNAEMSAGLVAFVWPEFSVQVLFSRLTLAHSIDEELSTIKFSK